MSLEQTHLFIVTAPSGTGKTTLLKRLIDEIPDLVFSVSHTTRAPRSGEIDGQDYHFTSVESFLALRDRGAFLEWADVHGNFYGTSRDGVEAQLEAGKDIVLDIDVAGADQVRSRWPGVHSIFIMPPSLKALNERLTHRNLDRPEVIQRRLQNSLGEVKRFDAFDFVVVNDELERCYRDVKAIFLAQRLRLDHQHKKIQNMIANCF